MRTTTKNRARLLAIATITLVTSALGAGPTWGRMLERGFPGHPMTATVVNNHGHSVVARVASGGETWTFDAVAPGEQLTFGLPERIRPTERYYLIADCEWTGERMVSEPIRADRSVRPHFMAGRDTLGSYVRWMRAPAAHGSHEGGPFDPRSDEARHQG